jgi:hypothetical protein
MPDPLSTTLSALADPTRRAILARLASGEATVNELAEPFEISLKDAADWIEHYRRFWEESFDRLDEYLKEVQAGKKPGPNKRRR